MGKKNLARTIIEGGRNEYYKDRRDAANRRDRRNWRDVELWVRSSPEMADEMPEIGERSLIGVYRGERFADKLAVIDRWLLSRVGRKWDLVYSELRQKFDCKSLMSQHLLYDHLLYQVKDNGIVDTGAYFSRFYGFWVDDEGVLRYESWRDRYRRDQARRLLAKLRAKIELSGRSETLATQ